MLAVGVGVGVGVELDEVPAGGMGSIAMLATEAGTPAVAKIGASNPLGRMVGASGTPAIATVTVSSSSSVGPLAGGRRAAACEGTETGGSGEAVGVRVVGVPGSRRGTMLASGEAQGEWEGETPARGGRNGPTGGAEGQTGGEGAVAREPTRTGEALEGTTAEGTTAGGPTSATRGTAQQATRGAADGIATSPVVVRGTVGTGRSSRSSRLAVEVVTRASRTGRTGPSPSQSPSCASCGASLARKEAMRVPA